MKYERQLIELSKKMKDKVKTSPSKNKGAYFNFVFLCGGEKFEGDNRETIANLLKKRKDIRCLYSEELFSTIQLDLLSFEELLVEASTKVLIVLESYGSACELGAFTFVDGLVEKIIVINDKEYKEEPSFINDGPIKKIKDKRKENIFFEEFETNDRRNILIPSSSLASGLQNSIPEKKSYQGDAISIDNNRLKIKDISYFLVLVYELIRFFGALEVKNIILVLMSIYDIDEFVFEFESGNKVESLNDSEKFNQIINFILELLLKFGLCNKNKNIYHTNYSDIEIHAFDFLKPQSLLFRSNYLKSLTYMKDKSAAVKIAKKRGYTLWEK